MAERLFAAEVSADNLNKAVRTSRSIAAHHGTVRRRSISNESSTAPPIWRRRETAEIQCLPIAYICCYIYIYICVCVCVCVYVCYLQGRIPQHLSDFFGLKI